MLGRGCAGAGLRPLRQAAAAAVMLMLKVHTSVDCWSDGMATIVSRLHIVVQSVAGREGYGRRGYPTSTNSIIVRILVFEVPALMLSVLVNTHFGTGGCTRRYLTDT